MIGVCFQEVGSVSVGNLGEPALETPTDAIVRVELAGLCGSDLHPFFGRETGLDPGTVMGHEFVGRVVETGSQVTRFAEGDRVCAPFSSSCGSCFYCQRGLTSRCERGQLFGWRSAGEGLHGGQAQLVRVPQADGTLVRLGDGISPEMGLLLGDNLSTGYFCAQMAQVSPEGVYVVIGCGTVGLLCILAAARMGATRVLASDFVTQRLEVAQRLGARPFDNTEQLTAAVLDETGGRGADAVMELVGLPEAQHLAYRLLRPGGVLAVIGCHCSPHFSFSPAEAYDKNLTYRTGRCPARAYMEQLGDLFRDDQEDLRSLITHRFGFDDGVHAYDVFANRKDGCIKAVFECP